MLSGYDGIMVQETVPEVVLRQGYDGKFSASFFARRLEAGALPLLFKNESLVNGDASSI